MFLALKEIKKEKSRFVMIVIVTALIAFLVYFLTGLAYGLASANTTSVEHWRSEGIILSKASNQNIYASSIEENVVKSLNLKSSESLNVASTVVSVNKNSDQFDLVLMGVEEKSKLILPKIIEGRKIKGNQEIILSSSFKKDFDIKIGDTLKIISTGREFDVVGFTEKSEYNTQTVGYVSLEMASQEMMMYKTGDEKTDAVATPTINMPNRISAIITNEKIDNKILKENKLTYLSKEEFINTIPGYQAQILTFGLMILSLIIISAFIISIFMYIITMQKKSIFAILKIQGISDSYISKSVIYQTIIVSLLGVFIGVILTLVTFNFLPNQVPVQMNWPITGIVSILFLICPLLGSLFSARSILKIDPLDAL